MAQHKSTMASPQIVTLPNTLSSSCLEEIVQGLNKPTGEKTLPTILLYDERGLRLYDDITTKAPEYYLFAAEEQILRDSSDEIVRLMHGERGLRNGTVVLELGAGALRKTSHLLKALANAAPIASLPTVTYLALDLEKRELDRTLSLISTSDLGPTLEDRVRIGGLCGTYDDGIAYVRGGGLADMQQNSPFLSPAALRASTDLLEPVANLDAWNKEGRSLPSPLTSEDDATSPSSVHRAPSPSILTETQSSYSLDYEETPPLHFLFLGSSIGNFTRDGAANFLQSLPLRQWTSSLEQGEGSFGDTLLLGLDHDNEPKLIELAYNDPAGYTQSFIMNGLLGVQKAFQESGMGPEAISAFDQNQWDYQEKYNTVEKRHEGRYLSTTKKALKLNGADILIDEGETIHVEHSYKYSETQALELFHKSNLQPIHRWISANGLYSLWLLHRPSFDFPIAPTMSNNASDDSTFPLIPTQDEWSNIWKLWDTVTLGMIPPELMMQKPIDLRHKCLFYLGHIPTFLDIHLSRLLKEPHTEPDNFKYIFERGIDPHVDDPSQCHPHSEVPKEDDEWPSLDSILAFRDRVRARLRSVYERLESGDLEKQGVPTRKAQRVLWMTYEHEAFHVETLLYMLIQKVDDPNGTRPPPGIPKPDWDALSLQWKRRLQEESSQESIITLGPANVWLGHDDYEAEDTVPNPSSQVSEFGWDNEHPKRMQSVAKFTIERRPITNGQYYEFWKSQASNQVPASWVVNDGSVMIRTLFGLVPLSTALEWPLMASYDELDSFAKSKGGRIPTESELRLFMDDQSSRGAVNTYNNAGWGYQRWWLEPSSLGNPSRNQAPHNGGVWEWTSTIMDQHEGYQPSILYPGYSSDFFDGLHHVVLGGSFATLPRLAQRRTLRNFYQHNYPYAWIGARIAYDA